MKKFIQKFTKEKIESQRIKNKHYFFEKEIHPRAISAGLYLGSEGKEFKPSLALLEILSPKTQNKVFVNSKAEWLFICGRDVFMNNVVKDKSEEDVFLVQNEKDENIGLGKKKKEREGIVIKNLLDKGNYLRRE